MTEVSIRPGAGRRGESVIERTNRVRKRDEGKRGTEEETYSRTGHVYTSDVSEPNICGPHRAKRGANINHGALYAVRLRQSARLQHARETEAGRFDTRLASRIGVIFFLFLFLRLFPPSYVPPRSAPLPLPLPPYSPPPSSSSLPRTQLSPLPLLSPSS